MLLPIGASALTAGCDSAAPGSPAVPPGDDFYPLAIGNAWTYDYVHTSALSGGGSDPPATCCNVDSTSGTLRWHVVDSREDGAAVKYEVEESFDGVIFWRTMHEEPWGPPEPRAWTRTVFIRDSLGFLTLDLSEYVPPYGRYPSLPLDSYSGEDCTYWVGTPVPRYYEAEGDTVSIAASECVDILSRHHSWSVVKGVGLAYMNHVNGRGPSYSSSQWWIRLRSWDLEGGT